MDNKDLKAKYNEMHSEGQSAWFDSGDIERQAILEIGEPWDESGILKILEIGCGDGGLVGQIATQCGGAEVHGVDYSEEAIEKARNRMLSRHRGANIALATIDYREVKHRYGRIVMQGVLEHLDKPFEELQWMIEHFKPKTVITSSPAFLNPRGIIWMTLDMLGAVMSKTDLHYLDYWSFEQFCKEHHYKLEIKSVDFEWASRWKMVEDLKQRIPLALKDGNIPYDERKLMRFIVWLACGTPFDMAQGLGGATNVYRIDIGG